MRGRVERCPAADGRYRFFFAGTASSAARRMAPTLTSLAFAARFRPLRVTGSIRTETGREQIDRVALHLNRAPNTLMRRAKGK